MTLSDFLETVYLPERQVGRAGAAQMRVAVRQIDEFHGSQVELEDLEETLVRKFLASFGEKHAAATCNSRRRDILSLWQAAADEDIVRVPNRRRIPRRRQPKRAPDAFTIEEIRQILDYLETVDGEIEGIKASDYWRSVVLAVYSTGCRISALRSTLTSDCDLSQRWLLVRAEFQKNGEDQVFPLTLDAADAIGRHYSADRKHVWPWQFAPKHFWLTFSRYVKASGVKQTRRGLHLFHKIRRSHGSYLAATAGLDAARGSLGHSDARLTLASYVDPRISQRNAAIDQLPSPLANRRNDPNG